jgi:hypothetical protein
MDTLLSLGFQPYEVELQGGSVLRVTTSGDATVDLDPWAR